MDVRTDIVTAGPVKEEVLAFAGYNDFEAAADRTAVKIKEGFMEMGYILKIARDTDILAGSEYTSHEDFAAKRYDLDKGTVSRYIRIVERFSVDGNSHLLKDNYKNMGFSKLSLMLHMPDAIAEELMDSLSKTDVLAIKEELDAEAQITDIELAIEQAETPVPEHATEGTLLQKTIRQLGREQPDLYRKIWQALSANAFTDIAEILAPHGDAVYMVRIPGMGRIMLSIQGDDVSVTAVRTQDKERHIMEEVHDAWRRICYLHLGTAENSYREEYGEEMQSQEAPAPQNAGVAPVQPPQPRKQSKVTKANTRKSKEPAVSPAAVVHEQEEQLPGQMEVTDFPELMPETDMQSESEAVQTPCNNTGEQADAAVMEAAPAAGMEMTDEGWLDLWNDLCLDMSTIVDIYNGYDYDEMINGEIPRSTLDEAYKSAVNVAAALERMINGKKYTAQ